MVVADSHYAKRVFLMAALNLPNLFILVRLACNRVLYGPPPVVTDPHRRGCRKRYGDKFRLKSPPALERQAIWTFGKATVHLSAWPQLHFKDVPALVGTVVRVEFLMATGQAMYKRPLWLFWIGPGDMPLEAVGLMYLLRFGTEYVSTDIEHFFRFAKRRLGLLIAQTPDLATSINWVWVVALAYAQLLLAHTLVTVQPHP